MKIHQILLQLQLNLFSSIGKLHLLWCMDNIQSIFLQIHFEFQIFIDIVSISFISMKIYQILVQLQINLFSSIGNYIYCDVWTIFSPHFTKYSLNFKFSLILYLYHSSQWKSIRYYCSSASKFLVQIESWIYCDAWTIFSPRCTSTLWISNFHCNCICIFNSMISIRYYCSSNSIFCWIWKLHLLWCMDNIK